ncbi:hypothetical protein BST65_22450 [Bradyrhizobium canariense]|nr:hypothetical protein BST65_22450 [Bradyrhizobium canariense]OSI33073.1 hypothetical protein BST66_14465 [Bradyrhizobium canariense]OSI41233.1 hypothetical protein BSZ20_22585 [Bradyrhizobium canariense]OSI46387.1 hypothetical protein BST67_25355 [Bradyrhizobium canariense]OSI51198.1 hypothetical protein BSZ15_31485 [Bradyrhizobium canariense]
MPDLEIVSQGLIERIRWQIMSKEWAVLELAVTRPAAPEPLQAFAKEATAPIRGATQVPPLRQSSQGSNAC